MSERSRSDSISHAVASGNSSIVESAEDILDKMGDRHPYIWLVMCTISLSWAITAMPIMCSSFLTDSNECRSEGRQQQTTTNTEQCESENRTSIISEFNLTGSKQYMAEWTTSAFMVGNMIGASCLTRISDKFGRRTVFIGSLTVLTLSGILSSMANTIALLTFGRLIQGICSPGTLLVAWVLAYECVPISLRGSVTLIFGVMWVIGYCAVAPLAYLITDWRWLMLACTLPSFLLAVIYTIMIPESLHFLIAHGKVQEMIEWIQKAERFGKFKDEQSIHLIVEILKTELSSGKLGFVLPQRNKRTVLSQLLRYKIFILYTVILVYLWTSDTFVYFGLSLYATRLAGNKYYNYALSGLVELPAYIAAPTVLENLGRRRIVSYTHFMAGIALISLIFISEDLKWLHLSCWLSAKFAISLSFMSIYVYGSEIFPTTMRNVCLGICVVIARIGGIAAPYVTVLAAISSLLPIIVFGTVSMVAGALTLLLPETKDRILPSSINDVTINNSK